MLIFGFFLFVGSVRSARDKLLLGPILSFVRSWVSSVSLQTPILPIRGSAFVGVGDECRMANVSFWVCSVRRLCSVGSWPTPPPAQFVVRTFVAVLAAVLGVCPGRSVRSYVAPTHERTKWLAGCFGLVQWVAGGWLEVHGFCLPDDVHVCGHPL
jgi:hypothetical protein